MIIRGNKRGGAYGSKWGQWRAQVSEARGVGGKERDCGEGGEGLVRSVPGDTWQVIRGEGGRVERRHRGIVCPAVLGAWLLTGVAGMDNISRKWKV